MGGVLGTEDGVGWSGGGGPGRPAPPRLAASERGWGLPGTAHASPRAVCLRARAPRVRVKRRHLCNPRPSAQTHQAQVS